MSFKGTKGIYDCREYQEQTTHFMQITQRITKKA